MKKIILALCLLQLVSSSLGAEIRQIWLYDDGIKVKRYQLPSKRPSYWKKESLQLFALRNEIISFQVIITGGEAETADISLAIEGLKELEHSNWEPYHKGTFEGNRIQIYKQDYLHVRHRSKTLPWEPFSDAQPKHMTGWVPDALTPIKRDSKFTLPAGENLAIWIDVYIPKDLPPGNIQGNLMVNTLANSHAMPIRIHVGKEVIPDNVRAKTMLWFSGSDDDTQSVAARYFANPWEEDKKTRDTLRKRHYQVARRHRITLIKGNKRKPDEQIRSRLNGQWFGKKEGYAGPGENMGQDVYSILTYNGKISATESRHWNDWFKRNFPKKEHFLYVWDEPSEKDFDEVNERIENSKPLKTFITHSYDSRIHADIFASPVPAYKDSHKKEAKQNAKKLWIYNGVRPFSGTFMIDDTAISPRVNAWIQYKHGIERWFYWEATYYHDAQGGRASIDIYNDPNNFRNKFGDRMNGDGLLLYPGRDLIFPENDRKIPAPIPSIRLKNWRRGIQDVEYMILAKKKGYEKEVTKIIETVIPRTLDQVEKGEPISWPENGENWYQARKLLFDIIERGKFDNNALIGLGLKPETTWEKLVRKIKTIKRRNWKGRRKLVLIALTTGSSITFVALFFLWRRKMKR